MIKLDVMMICRDNIRMCKWMCIISMLCCRHTELTGSQLIPLWQKKIDKARPTLFLTCSECGIWCDMTLHMTQHIVVVDCLFEPAAGAFQRVTKTQGWDRDGGNWCVRVYFGRECKGRLYIECFATHGVLNTLLGLGAVHFMHGKQQ